MKELKLFICFLFTINCYYIFSQTNCTNCDQYIYEVGILVDNTAIDRFENEGQDFSDIVEIIENDIIPKVEWFYKNQLNPDIEIRVIDIIKMTVNNSNWEGYGEGMNQRWLKENPCLERNGHLLFSGRDFGFDGATDGDVIESCVPPLQNSDDWADETFWV